MTITFHRFIAHVKHDGGTIRMHVNDTDVESVKNRIMAAEGCPERSILKVIAVDKLKYEMVLNDPSKYVVLGPIPVTSISTDTKPTRDPKRTLYEVRTIDQRWRRVYKGVNFAGDKVLYVLHDGIKTIVTLPASYQ